MDSANDLLFDEAIRHQINLNKYSTSLVHRMIAVLNRADARLFAELAFRLQDMTAANFTAERLESMLGSVRAMNAQAYAQLERDLRQELRDFVDYEAAYQHKALFTATPVQVHIAAVSAEQVYTAALARPFQGVLLKGVLADLEAGRAKKIRQTIAQGYAENKTTDQIIRELRGTKAKGYSDGLWEAPRRDVEAVTRTALGHMARFTQDQTVEANLDLIKALAWSATLDLKTSPICRIRDKKTYTPGAHKPIGHSLPWLGGPGAAHWRCRSHATYVLKSHKELGIDLPEIETRGGTRASMDGQLPKETSYQQWLQKQSYARQIEVLGPQRAKLMKDGKLPLDKMYGDKGQMLTLSQMRERDAWAFKRAGL